MSPSASAQVEPAVLLEVLQLRGDVATGHIELRVTNETHAPLTVVRATYDSNRWSAQLGFAGEAEIPAGARRNLRLQLPEPTCDTAPLDHRAAIELVDGTVLEQEPADPQGQLQELDAPVCDLRRFEREVASLDWLEPRIPAAGAGAAVLRLEVTPVAGAAGERGTLDALTATPLLTPVDASGTRIAEAALGLEIVPGAAPTVLEVPIEPGRCDLHAIAEDKQGTVFRVRGSVAGEPIELVLVTPEAQRGALLTWVVEHCTARDGG